MTDSGKNARRLDTSQEIAESKMGKVQELETDEGNYVRTSGGENMWDSFYNANKYKDVTDDLERLDILEGLNLEDLDFSEDLDWTLVEKVEVGTKVVDSLKAKSHMWVELGPERWFSRLFRLV